MNKKLALVIAFIMAVIIVLSVKNAESASTPLVAHAASTRTAAGPARIRPISQRVSKELNPHEEMVQLVEKVPTKDSLKKTGDPDVDAHRSPVEIAEMSEVIGKILDRAHADKGFQSEALWFFEQCTLKPKVLSSIGVTCLHYLRKLAKETSTEIDLKRFPEKFVQQTDQIIAMEEQN